jgi:autotransporter-associated beta strand protein
MLSAANATVIAGGTANLGANVTNLARAGMGNLGYTIDATVKSGSVTLGSLSPTPGLLAEGASQNHTVTATSSNIGLNTVSFTANTDGFNPTETATATLTVLDHAAPTLSSLSANVRVMKGASATASTSLQNTSATYRAGLQIVNLGGMTGAAVGDVIAKGSSKTLIASVSSSTTGLISTPFTVKVSDDRSISGATDRPDQTFTVNASVLDDRRVTAPGNTDIGYVHLGGTISGNVALSTTGDDNHFTRITVANSSAADSNGIAVSGGTTSFRFGLDGMTTTRSLGGTPKALGTVQGTLSLTTGAESGVTGTQTLANVPVGYTVHVYSGKASWNAAAGGSWGDHTKWQDNLSVSGGSPGIANFGGDSATFGNAIGSNTSEITLNGNSPKLELLSFNNNQGGSYTISSASNETLTITGAAGTPTIGVNNGNHRIASPIVLTGSSTISVVNSVDSLALNGNVSVSGGLTKTGNGTLALTGANTFDGTVVISEGAARGPVRSLGNAIVNNSTLICDQDVDANFSGSMTGTGAFTKMGAAKVTLAGADNFKTTGPIAVAQGTLATPYGIPYEGAGISIANGANYIAGGTVNRSISGFGSVAASDDLTIGKSASTGQFNQGGAPGQGGTLIVGQNAVIILSKDRAILGTLTNLDAGGSLTTINGSQLGNAASLDVSKILRAAGNATINGDFINNGLVCGPSASGEWLTFTQDVKGAGNTTGNICYAGSYSPGNSPACITSENLLLDPTNSLIMEIGGSTPGVQYDQLRVSQLAALDGTLSINTIDGYALDPNKSYDLIAGPITGQFDQVMGLPAGWSLNYLPNGVSIAVPEPSSGMLISLAIGLLTLAFGKTKRTAATAI